MTFGTIICHSASVAQDNTQLVARSATRFLTGTFLSRCTGMFRDLSMAFCFGSHPAVAAFMVAFRFANLFRRLFGEGAIPSAFTPHFETLKAESPEKGAQFFRDLFFSLALFLSVLILVLEGVLFGLLRLKMVSADNASIVTLTMLMLPGIFFICLFGLTSALLQCDGKYFLAGVAPIAFNIVWVAAVWWLRGLDVSLAMAGLAFSVILSFAIRDAVGNDGTWVLVPFAPKNARRFVFKRNSSNGQIVISDHFGRRGCSD
jgi:putative peptidoglycan lipid II flippase